MNKKKVNFKKNIKGKSLKKKEKRPPKGKVEVVPVGSEHHYFPRTFGIRVRGVYPPGIRMARFVGDRSSSTVKIVVGGVYPPGAKRAIKVIDGPDRLRLPRPVCIIEGTLEYNKETRQYIFTPLSNEGNNVLQPK